MSCLAEGTLREYLDQELSKPEMDRVAEHLSGCGDCGARLAAVRARSDHFQNMIGERSDLAADPALAFQRFVRKHGSAEPVRPIRRPLWTGVAAASVLIFLLSFAPARSWGQKFLAMLRVQKVVVMPVDIGALNVTSARGHKVISQLISDNVVVTMKPGEPEAVPDLASATRLAGYTVRTFADSEPPSKISVHDQGAFHMQLDRERIQAVLDEVGRSDIAIPESVNGSTVAVHVPKSVHVTYGSCSKGGVSCIEFMQMPSPTISVPPTLDIKALAEAGLQVAGLSAANAHAFCQTVDWSSTLVIPVPDSGSTVSTVPVDGAKGTLVQMAARGSSSGAYSLIWLKEGVIYSLSGSGSADRALAMAESLQ